MKEKQIITIGRQLGSGGREVGRRLSQDLGIPLYDKELLDEAAKKSGYSKEIFEKHDEKPTNSFLYALAMGVNNFATTYQRPLMLEIYLAQFNTIRKLAEEGPGIFLGRCADYVLSDMEPVFNVFLHADLEFRIARMMEQHNMDHKEAEGACLRGDKDRANYYNYYSNHEWGDSRHYDLTVNTGKLGIDKTVELIKSCL
ncbi:MAG: cytidylate kinase-like family protein [Lachnospiraceae bacterium]|nr:cytidylate kinase-like family protein [Lachnospiraceae bacterium]MCR5127281.1 cytidylate kinase-like family protein [Lachnospiraceae bacterium]